MWPTSKIWTVKRTGRTECKTWSGSVKTFRNNSLATGVEMGASSNEVRRLKGVITSEIKHAIKLKQVLQDLHNCCSPY